MDPSLTRRSVLAALTAAVLRANAQQPQSTNSGHGIRLGAPIFIHTDDPSQLAQEHRRLSYGAAYCPQADIHDKDRIRAIEQAFRSANVVIAEVGAWKNMLDPDTTKRRENLEYVTERCALADAVGARCCVDIAGSYNPTVWYGPNPKNLSKEFFDATVENCRHIIDTVKPTRTKFTIEMMGWNLPDGPDSYLDLIRAVDRPAFGVHLDVCNGVNCPIRFYNNTDFIRECCRKLGKWIVSCHAKDLQWITELNIHFQEVIPGRGQIDYQTYLTELNQLDQDTPLMIEHLKTAAEYDEAATYIRSVAAKSRITLLT
ncbi:MAG TPA: TIM barrel protein [Bryobacteraceae bacterium]|jgi:sugar phosphate isomerase/epimerase|nr:TIM barrel protein [Bryobacteraceae bacterium]